MNFGILLLILLAFLSLLGSFSEIAFDLFAGTIYSSLLFKILSTLLFYNLISCTIVLLPNLWRKTFTYLPPYLLPKENPLSKSFVRSDTLESSIEQIDGLLKGANFRTKHLPDIPNLIYANKGRLSPWGTHLVHLSLLIILISAFASSTYSSSKSILLPLGTKYVTEDSGIELEIEDFEFKKSTNEEVFSPVSQITLINKKGNKVSASIEVNHPVDFEKFRIYQEWPGYSADVKIKNDKGEVLYENHIFEGGSIEFNDQIICFEKYVSDFDPKQPLVSKSKLDNNPRVVFVLANTQEALGYDISPDHLINISESLFVEFSNITPHAYVTIKNDPSVTIAIIGFIFMSVGFFISLYIKFSEVWIEFVPIKEGRVEVFFFGKNFLDSILFAARRDGKK